MTDVVLEGPDLDRVTLAALGALPARFDWGVQVGDSEETVRLVDPEGAPLATLDIDSVTYGIATGTLTDLHPPEHGAFARLRRGPGHLPPYVTGLVFLDGPPTEELIAALQGSPVALVPLVGHGRRGLLGHDALVRACLGVLTHLPPGSTVLPLPVPAGDEPLLEEIALAYQLPRVAVPDGTTYPAAVQVELDGVAAKGRGGVILLTGLSGSGKSTLARGLRDRAVEAGREVTLLDGDVVRRLLSQGLGFTAEDRDLNVRRIGYVAAEVARHGGLAIAAPIAPYARSRSAVREMAEAAGASYVLVHVSTPLEVCEERDRKGHYAKARSGEIPAFTGISDPYEAPEDADLTIDTTKVKVGVALDRLVALLKSRKLL